MRRTGGHQVWGALAIVGQLGFLMVFCIMAGLLAGMYLDKLAGTGWVFAIALLLAGIGAGMVASYRVIMKSVVQPGCDEGNDR